MATTILVWLDCYLLCICETDPMIYTYSALWDLDNIITMHLKYTEMVLGYKVHFQTLDPGKTEKLVDNESVTISSIPLDHRIPCTGFLFKEKPKSHRLKKTPELQKMTIEEITSLKNGLDVLEEDGSMKYLVSECTDPPRKSRAYAYCSDTRYNESIIEHIKSVDLLYHESTFLSDQKTRLSRRTIQQPNKPHYCLKSTG